MTVPARTPGTGAAPTEGRPDAAGGSEEPAVALVAPPSPTELVEGAVATWRAALVESAGGSTLVDVEELGDAALDLSAAHPSGMAQLFAGRPTRLSNLVREGAALTVARRRARAVGARASVYGQHYGIAATSLAIGIATWTERTARDVANDDVAALATVTRRIPVADRVARTSPVPTDDAAPPAPRPRVVRAPVLLRPVTLTARGAGEADYELTLEPTVEVNPVLARALRARGALLDPAAVARGTFAAGGFDPRGALHRLTSLGEAVLEGFTLTERVVVGTFVHPGQVLVDDLDALAGTLDRHELVAALAGVDEDAERLQRPLPSAAPGDRDPQLDRGVGDLDPDQQHVLDVVATGAHLFVDAPAGADVTGTVAALVADAAATGRSVLYVPGHRRAAAALGQRLDEVGAGDLLLDVAPEAGWRTAVAHRLLAAMTLEPPTVDGSTARELTDALVEHREALRGYVRGLHASRQPWGVSAYDALQHLARLTSSRPAPHTTVRLTPDVARTLDAAARAATGSALARAAELGAFTLRPGDTPWFGADVRTPADAEVVLHRLDRLLDGSLPGVLERAAQVAVETGLTPPVTLGAWGEQLRMLDEVRAALDVFQPLVFERTAADLVAATATKQWREQRGIEMGFWLRRRLRKQARDMLRPGRPVADLHAELLAVQRRRELWQTHCPAGGWPRLPDGLELVEEEYAAVRLDLDALEAVLAGTPAGGGLLELPIPALVERLSRLRATADALDTLPERTSLLSGLRRAGLGELVDDLSARRVSAALAPTELDLAWWSTVFEQILTADPALAGYDGATLGALSARYAELDRAHVAARTAPVRAAVVGQMSAALRGHREQAEALFGELVEDRLTSLRDAVVRFPDVARRLRPVLAASPMLVPQVAPPTRTVDLVVLDAVGHLPLEATLAAIGRGRQVVVIGDARCASGSALRELSRVLPSVALRADASRRDPWLTAFLAGHGYDGVLSPTPLPDATPLVGLQLVDGTALPDVESGTVDSTPEEVQAVVELVVEHALSRPEESLAVVTVTPRHADAVREVVLSEARDNPALAAFFSSGRPEPFVVVDLANVAGLRREAVILSVGLGRTPHRRVLHSFGAISAPGGDGLLLDALGSGRHRLTVVSCFAARDLDPERVRGAGPHLLADLLAFAEARGAGSDDPLLPFAGAASGPVEPPTSDGAVEAPTSDTAAGLDEGSPATSVTDDDPTDEAASTTTAPEASREPDRLVLDLAERLWRHGLVVEVDHGLPGGARLPLAVGHPAVPDRLLVAVLTDDEAYVDEPSVRVRDRLVPERLERLGWSVLRVWSAAAFLDPQAEVDRIRRAVHAALPAPDVVPTSPRIAPVVRDQDDQPDDEPDDEPGKLTAAASRPAVQPDGAAPSTSATPTSATPTSAAPTSATPTSATPTSVASPDASVGVVPASAVPAPRRPQDEGSPSTDVSGPRTAPVRVSTGVLHAVPSATPVQLALAVPSRPRPDIRRGLPIGAYSDDELDELVDWLRSDGQERSRDELGDALRAELGITRRNHRIDTAVRAAVTRALS